MGPTSSNKGHSSWIAATIFVAVPVIYYHWQRLGKDRRKREADQMSLSKMARQGSQLKPPFPELVRNMLSKCRLAYLSTVDAELGSSHLSLMRFTYLQDEHDGEILVMSTNQRTKKFEMLQRQKGVALLVHDFGLQQNSTSSSNAGLYSITLNGNCRIVDDPAKAEYFRLKHLAHNPDYPQFIVGNEIAMLCVDVTSARICDINDQVTKWEVGQANN